MWLLKQSEWAKVPPETVFTCINGNTKKASELTDADNDTRFGYTAWGIRECDLNALHQSILSKSIPVAPPAPNPLGKQTAVSQTPVLDSECEHIKDDAKSKVPDEKTES